MIVGENFLNPCDVGLPFPAPSSCARYSLYSRDNSTSDYITEIYSNISNFGFIDVGDIRWRKLVADSNWLVGHTLHFVNVHKLLSCEGTLVLVRRFIITELLITWTPECSQNECFCA